MQYHWIRLESAPGQADLEADRLFELGALGVEERPAGHLVAILAYFSGAGAWRAACEYGAGRPGFDAGAEGARDWLEEWRSGQRPIEVTAGLTVLPPWWSGAAGSAHLLRMEAGMAFGMGSHESTRLAAELLESVGALDKRVLDIGAGTGILGLYAARLGAASVAALDVDPVTGPCLRENWRANRRGARAAYLPFVGTVDALKPGGGFDLILCNMLRTELWPFRRELPGRLAPGGAFIVSGQLLKDREIFQEDSGPAGYRIVREKTMDIWWGFTGERA